MATPSGQPPVKFMIDGTEFEAEDRKQTAAELLVLAGMDPGDHDLARVRGPGKTENLEDGELVQLTPGARFVSIFTGSTPVA